MKIQEGWIWDDNCLRCLCHQIWVTLAIFRLSGNIPCWIETLKTWNRIFFKISYASIIMLLLKSSKPATLFRFKLLNASSNSSKFNYSSCIFFLFIKIHNFNDQLEIWWRNQKSRVTLITILVFFDIFWKILCSTTLMLKLRVT